MTPIILNGKELAEKTYEELGNKRSGILAIITVGDDPASAVYVRRKIKACERIGLTGINYRYSYDAEVAEIIADKISRKINELNKDPKVVGIIVQQPFPEKLGRLENLVTTNKDVDGLNAENMGLTLQQRVPTFYPATPFGVMKLLTAYGISVAGKNVTVIGRSDIVGKPIAAMMSAANATVTLCHSRSKDVKMHTKQSDIIITAVGKPRYFDKSYLDNAESGKRPVIIDIAICYDENHKLCGDVDFEKVAPLTSYITPVPGSVGPMTILSLLLNCLKFISN